MLHALETYRLMLCSRYLDQQEEELHKQGLIDFCVSSAGLRGRRRRHSPSVPSFRSISETEDSYFASTSQTIFSALTSTTSARIHRIH